MRGSFLFLGCTLLGCTLLAIAGCSTTEYRVDGGPSPDASLPMGELALETEPSLTLGFGEASELVARYTESGAPVAGVSIRFALEGRAHDATLGTVSATTDREGRVRTSMTAGSTASVFRVRVSADRAAPAYVNVSVGNMGFGGLRVGAVYSGARVNATRRVVEVYSEMSCADALPPSPDRTTALERETDTEAVFAVLPAGLRYAVFGRVLGASAVVLASACAEIEIVRDSEVRVDLAFEDEPLLVDGDYDAIVTLASSVSSAAVAELASAAGTAPIAAAGSGAALYLNALDQELRDRGATSAADVLATERLSGAPDASLIARLDDAGVGPELALDAVTSALSTRLSSIALRGPLVLDTRSGTLDAGLGQLALAVGPAGVPDSPPLTIDAIAAGLDFAPSLAVSFEPSDARIGVDSLAFSMPLGTLTRATIAAEASARGYDSDTELLLDGAGCEVLSDWVAESPTLAPVCDADCSMAACVRALDAIVAAFEVALSAADETHDRAEVSGTILLSDDDGDLVVDRLAGEMLEGSWSSAIGPGDALGAELTGTRAAR